MQELWFLHSACPLMLVDICVKFHDASLYGLKVLERTRWRQGFVRDITKTSPCNEHPLTPHFYVVKLGFTGVYIFSYFCSKTLIVGTR